MPYGNGGEALVHHQILPGTRQQHYASARGGGYGGEAEGGRVDFCGRLQHGPREDRRPGKGQGYCGSGGDGRPRRSYGALPPGLTGMVQLLEEVCGGESGESSAVPDGLHPRIRPPYLP